MTSSAVTVFPLWNSIPLRRRIVQRSARFGVISFARPSKTTLYLELNRTRPSQPVTIRAWSGRVMRCSPSIRSFAEPPDTPTRKVPPRFGCEDSDAANASRPEMPPKVIARPPAAARRISSSREIPRDRASSSICSRFRSYSSLSLIAPPRRSWTGRVTSRRYLRRPAARVGRSPPIARRVARTRALRPEAEPLAVAVALEQAVLAQRRDEARSGALVHPEQSGELTERLLLSLLFEGEEDAQCPVDALKRVAHAATRRRYCNGRPVSIGGAALLRRPPTHVDGGRALPRTIRRGAARGPTRRSVEAGSLGPDRGPIALRAPGERMLRGVRMLASVSYLFERLQREQSRERLPCAAPLSGSEAGESRPRRAGGAANARAVARHCVPRHGRSPARRGRRGA